MKHQTRFRRVPAGKLRGRDDRKRPPTLSMTKLGRCFELLEHRNLLTSVNLPTSLLDGSGYDWPIQQNGQIGSTNGLNYGFSLAGFSSQSTGESDLSGQQIAVGTTLGTIELNRKVYVPDDSQFIRYLDSVTNLGTEETTYTLEITSDLRSDEFTETVLTSSGDFQFTPDDHWIATDDRSDTDGRWGMIHVVSGEGGTGPTAASLAGTGGDRLSYSYDLTLAPGETQVVMQFGAQTHARTSQLIRAAEISRLAPELLSGMSTDELAQVVNFDTSSVGADLTPPTPPLLLTATFFDGANFPWNIKAGGAVEVGSSAFNGAGGLRNLAERPSSRSYDVEDDGRELILVPHAIGDIRLDRKIYVPDNAQYARFLDFVTNTSDTFQTYSLEIQSNLGSDNETQVVDTSSGDQVFTTADNWIVTDDVDFTSAPPIAHVIGDDEGLDPATATLTLNDVLTYTHFLTLAPGQTQIVMHFGVQADTRSVALQIAEDLAAGTEPNMLSGLSPDELTRIVNFDVAPSPPIIPQLDLAHSIDVSGNGASAGPRGVSLVEGEDRLITIHPGDIDDHVS